MHELSFIERILTDLAPLVRDRAADPRRLEISEKSEAVDLVTEVDLEVQRRIESAISEAFPDDVLVAEEAGKDHPPDDPAARCWVLDPIDGTHNFARGLMPAYGISLAFVVEGQPAAAGVALPGLGDLFLAQKNGGTFRNGRRIHVSDIGDITRARVEIDFVRRAVRPRVLATATKVMLEAGQMRNHGSAVVGLCSVAGGHADAFFHPGPQAWDFAAAMLLVREAGGRVTHLDGEPVGVFDQTPAMLATNGHLHEALLSLLTDAPAP